MITTSSLTVFLDSQSTVSTDISPAPYVRLGRFHLVPLLRKSINFFYLHALYVNQSNFNARLSRKFTALPPNQR